MTRPSVAVDSRSTTFLTAALGHADSGVIGVAIRVAAVVFVTVLTAAASQVSVPLPFTPVPFTFQPVVVLLGGALLGPAWAR